MSSEPEPLIAEQIAAAPVFAEVIEHADGWVLTMRRVLAHDRERVWAMLTEPEQLRRWSPLVPDRPLITPGPATSHETPDSAATDVEVLAVDPPTVLVHRWGPDVVRWRLVAVPDGTELTLEHRFRERPQAPEYAAGWHICLGVLSARDAGRDVPRVVGPDALRYGWHGLRDRYAALFAPNEESP